MAHDTVPYVGAIYDKSGRLRRDKSEESHKNTPKKLVAIYQELPKNNVNFAENEMEEAPISKEKLMNYDEVQNILEEIRKRGNSSKKISKKQTD